MSDSDVEAILARLQEEVRLLGPASPSREAEATPVTLAARNEGERLWAVSADRPYYYRPGTWGRVRGLLLLVVKAPAKRLMRWYVEPAFHEQRQFNSVVLRMIDELALHVGVVAAENRRLRARLDAAAGSEAQGLPPPS